MASHIQLRKDGEKKLSLFFLCGLVQQEAPKFLYNLAR